MLKLMRSLRINNRYHAPVGGDGEIPGGSADEPSADDPQVNSLADDHENESTAEDAKTSDDAVETKTENKESEEPSDLVITLDGSDLVEDDADELPANVEPKTSAAFAKMRADKKRLERELRELKARQESGVVQSAPATEPPGDEPTLEGCEYDAEDYAGKLKNWLIKKSDYEAKQREAEAEQRKQAESWSQRLTAYRQEAGKLKRADFDDAEAAVKSTFSVVQQGLLLKHPKAAALVYVLGKNPARAKTLSAIADPVDFAYAAAELAGQVKVERKSPPPLTDEPVRGRSSGAAVASQTLESLRDQGRRTGDYSAYFAAKRAADARKVKAA